jgi:hypothetical protein
MNGMMQLVVGWTLVGAFAFTVAMTCLSLPGWIKFADRSQQRKLFATVIVELVVVFGANAVGITRLDPTPVSDALKTEGGNTAVVGILGEMLGTDPASPPHVTREQAEALVGRLKVENDAELRSVKADFQKKVQALPKGTLTPEAIHELRPFLDRARTSAIRPK